MVDASAVEQLEHIPLFRGMKEGQLSWIRERTHRSTFRSKTRVLTAGQPANVMYILLEGAVKVQTEQLDGSEFLLNVLTYGDLIGATSLIQNVPQAADAITLGKCVTLWMDRNTFHECLYTMPSFSINALELLSRQIHRVNERMQAIATFDVRGRVAHQLLSFADRCGQVVSQGDILIPIRLTQGDIAHMVGASRERVNQVMMGFKRQRYLSVNRRYHIILHQRAEMARRWCLTIHA
jgi:CRP/FNR family cyclic AMP-dependent transcriptional regulator